MGVNLINFYSGRVSAELLFQKWFISIQELKKIQNYNKLQIILVNKSKTQFNDHSFAQKSEITLKDGRNLSDPIDHAYFITFRGISTINIMLILSNSNLCYENVQKSSKIRIGQYGIFAKEEIRPNQILLTVKQEHALCFSTIPSDFKQQFAFLEGVTINCQPHQPAKPISLDSELLLLYLIFEKTRASSENSIFTSWLSRPVNGLFYFDRQVIEQVQNLDLLISYVALHNHLSSLTKGLFEFLQKRSLPALQLLMNSQSCELKQFQKLYAWSYHFVNSRSFGYTNEYTLIPIFDMMNHSSTNDNVQQIVSDIAHPNAQDIDKLRSDSEEQDESYKSDNDSEQEQPTKTTKIIAKFLDLYYHVISTETIRTGEQVLIKYGSRNNMFLIEGYGFVEQFNRYDSLYSYFSVLNEEIHFDSVRGTDSLKFKFKRETFDFNFLIGMKRHYYSKFYGKSHEKAKILWSIPKDKAFQKYFILQVLKRMSKYPPKVHMLTPNNGSHELALWEKERRAIFECNQRLVYYLYQQLGWSKEEVDSQLFEKWAMSGQQTGKIPQSLIEYGRLLKKLNG